MKEKVKKYGIKVSMVMLTFVVLFGAWNWTTVTEVSRPSIRAIMATVQKTPEPSYDGTKEHFFFPRLGIDVPMTDSPDTSPLRSQDWNSIRAALTRGVSLNYSGNSLDESRLAFITGHSSDTYPHDYSSVFAPLGQAKEGDTFVVTGGGSVRTYVVRSKQVVDPRNVLAFSENALLSGTSGNQSIALVTCWPLLTNLKRMVIVGERVGEPVRTSYTTN